MKTNRFPGKIDLKIEGNKIEKLLTLSLTQGIIFQNIERTAYNSISVTLKYKQFDKIKQICQKYNFSITVLKKRGLASLVRRLQNRRGFFVGLLICVLALIYLNTHVWAINVEGLVKKENKIVEEFIAQNDIKIGMLKSEIDIENLERKILKENPQIAWVAVGYNGTHLNVELSPAVLKPKIEDVTIPCDIIANKDGIITKINVFRGSGLVQVGDQVQNGQKIVGGQIQHEQSGKLELVHAEAEIQARIWYERTFTYKKEDVINITTGMVSKGWQIGLDEEYINITDRKNDNNYRETEDYRFCIPFINRVTIRRITKEEIDASKQDVSRENFIELAKEKAFNELVKELRVEGKIIDKKYRCDIIEEEVKISVYLETIENIGIKNAIDGGNE